MAVDPNAQLATMLANIPEKTGKSLQEWLELLSNLGLDKHGQILKYLKGEHAVTHGFANLIAAKFIAKAEENTQESDLVEAQYSGTKSSLRPLYNHIVEFAQSLDGNVVIAPKKSSVSLRHAKQFALITPATKTRIDLGLALKGEVEVGRLETYNAMCSHRIRLDSIADFDEEAKDWMKLAFERAG